MTTDRTSAEGRTPNRWGEGQRLRAEILAAARRLLREGGAPEEISLRAIARETGIAAPSVYKHFRDKAELMATVLDELHAELAEAMSAAAQSAPDPWSALTAAIDLYWRFATQQRQRYQFMFHIGPMLSVEGSQVYDSFGRVLEVWKQVVGDYLADAGKATPHDFTAHLLWSGLHGQLGVWWGISHEAPEQPALELREALLLSLFDRR
nr:TetR/AcrR family transcriptional regulator [Kibdelosporangium sp. MJ126-NF4]CEL17155.1 Transcriptional regulator, TetR family [Kibdelosporangium sp. MJ126-NF4]CTQ91616.1 Transcriptional regulator, TetR family [Kibdelosporangium sp. MJ126-NF4]